MSGENKVIPNNRKYCPTNFVDKEINGQIIEGAWRQLGSQTKSFTNIRRLGSNNYGNIAVTQRNVFRDYFVSKIGESLTPWQYKYVFDTDREHVSL